MGIGSVWSLFRKLDGLLQVEEIHRRLIADLNDQMVALDRRLLHLESRQDIVVNEAKAAARSASYEATQGVAADLARRIGALEAAATAPKRKRIGPPKP